MFAAPALWVAFAAMLPVMAYACWSDIKHLKLPNWIPLAVLGIYVVTGLWGLPLERFLWGLCAGAITLVVFFAVWALADSFLPGNMGAGDVKLLAVLVPFVDLREAFPALVLFTVVLIAFLVVFMVVFAFSSKKTGLRSLDREEKKAWKVPSPFGVALAVTAVIFLGLKTWDTLG